MSDLSLRSQLGSFHANVISIASVTGTNTSLPGNLNIQGSANVVGSLTAATASITGSLMVAGTNVTGGGLSDYQYGSLNMRVFDDTSVYARATLTSGGPLPVPFLSRPVGDTPFSTLSFSQATFGTSVSAYSARVSGYVNPPYSGTYLFRTTFQDGATLYIGLQKLCDSWTYVGSTLQSVGTITLAQNVWQPLVLEHAASSTLTERLLLEFSTNSGSVYSTLAHGTASNQFQMAYNVKETPTALQGSSYNSGRAYFADVASFNSALTLPNATSFSGRTSELRNDAGFLLSGSITGNISATGTLSVASASITGSLTLGGSLNSRGITPSSVVYTQSASVALTQSVQQGYSYTTGSNWSLVKSMGPDAVAMLQTSSGVFIAQTKALYTISWTGYSPSSSATFCIVPTTSTYGLTATAASGTAFLLGVTAPAANGVFNTSLILPMAVGDGAVLYTNTNGASVQNSSLSITAQPLGAY